MRILAIPRAPIMAKGKLTISIDLELAWGVWDVLTAEHIHLAETAERPICAALIELFDRYEIPATWAIVAALLDEASSSSRPGSKTCWYAPDIIEQLVSAKVAHEIGSHSGRHIYFDTAPAPEARADLDFARDVHTANKLPFKSFIFPRGACGHLDQLARVGLHTYSHSDVGWTVAARRAGHRAGASPTLSTKSCRSRLTSPWPRSAMDWSNWKNPCCLWVEMAFAVLSCPRRPVPNFSSGWRAPAIPAAFFISGFIHPISITVGTSSSAQSRGVWNVLQTKRALVGSRSARWAPMQGGRRRSGRRDRRWSDERPRARVPPFNVFSPVSPSVPRPPRIPSRRYLLAAFAKACLEGMVVNRGVPGLLADPCVRARRKPNFYDMPGTSRAPMCSTIPGAIGSCWSSASLPCCPSSHLRRSVSSCWHARCREPSSSRCALLLSLAQRTSRDYRLPVEPARIVLAAIPLAWLVKRHCRMPATGQDEAIDRSRWRHPPT